MVEKEKSKPGEQARRHTNPSQAVRDGDTEVASGTAGRHAVGALSSSSCRGKTHVPPGAPAERPRTDSRHGRLNSCCINTRHLALRVPLLEAFRTEAVQDHFLF